MRRRESLQKRDKQYYAAGKLYGEHAADFLKSYRKRKRILVISILAGSVILAVFAMIREMRNPKLVDGRYIVRDEKGGSEKNVTVEARSENGFSKVMQIRVVIELKRFYWIIMMKILLFTTIIYRGRISRIVAGF